MTNPQTLPTDSEIRDYRFAFTGSGGEYFGIWIVNLLLSILTLGIYSAWAKVRREQYFHRNTLLDDQPFDYTGKPLAILLGRIIALVVLLVGSGLQEINWQLSLGVTLFFAIAYPWVIVRSLRFRARNTRYRNLAFRFTGTTLEAFKVYFWIYLALLPMVVAAIFLGGELTVALALGGAMPELTGTVAIFVASVLLSLLLYAGLTPVYLHHIRAFQHSHLRYGNAQGGFQSSVGAFYHTLVKAGLMSLLAFVLILVVGGSAGYLKQPWLFLLAYPILFLPQAFYTVALTNLTYECANLGEQHFRSDMKVGDYLWLLFSNALLVLFTAGLAWPWAKVRLARYRLEHMAFIASPAALVAIAGEAAQDVAALGEEAAEFLDFDISL